jgi:tRNA threonylcarbamoyladenosine biosynthesis protein TsaB
VLLAIDSSTGTSVAVVDDDGRVLARAGSPDTRGHAEIVGAAMADALAEAGVVPADVDVVAVGMGPGPFTGLRVGIAAARAFAFARGARLVPVASHDAAALAATPGRASIVVTDARRREVAFTVYAADGRRERGPELARPERLDELVPGLGGLERLDVAEVDAGLVGRLARRILAGDAVAGEEPEPLYLRPPDAVPLAARAAAAPAASPTGAVS